MLAKSGAGYFLKGFDLINTKGLRRFVLIPLIINFIIFGVAFYFLFGQLNIFIEQLLSWLPEWLLWLEYIIWPFAIMTILIGFSFIFSALANWIAAPFNGLLSEKVEALLTNKPLSGGTLSDVVKDIPRTLSREWCKFRYYLPRAIGFFIIMWFIPVIGQLIWFLFVSWMMAVQYLDYPFDNHKINFDLMKQQLNEKKGQSYGFGITTALFSMVPLVNMIVMPVAICGATALWVDHYKDKKMT
ncbi:sulfate transporter CysZ [Thalassotalea sp. M1531]|uniref:Sulfate transporter CysZ n=1 Tax=Thalassotalea algicola TaxID=2716224 RepID=A0A7Y0LDW9_9GAMM|nr:sulfate transporter CysZ [Thalassotalea algicola]NMP31360.1 sulfate transporter CysZ [Thalassotalea algicola]